MGKWRGGKRAVEEPKAEAQDAALSEAETAQSVAPQPEPIAAEPVLYEAPSSEPIASIPPQSVEQPVGIPTEKPAMNTSIRLPIEPAASSGAPTVIRAGLHLDGNIRTTNDILLEGSVRGEVTANSITVAAGATLSGNVSATVIVVDGTIEGVVRCLKLQVNTTGAVSGEIHHSILVVEAGAAIEGTVFRTDRVTDDLPAAPVALRAEPAAVVAYQPKLVQDTADEDESVL